MAKKILLIDDSKQILITYKKALMDINLIVEVAQSREEALQKIQQENYDLVLVDLELPIYYDLFLVDLELPNVGSDKTVGVGFILISEIKSLHKELPIVVLSGHSDRAFIAEAYRLGANQFIAKGKLSLGDFQQEIEDILDLQIPPRVDYDLELKQRERKRIERRLKNLQDQIDILDERELNLRRSLTYETDTDKVFGDKKKILEFQELIKELEQESEAYKVLLQQE